MITDPLCVGCKRPMSPAGASRWVCMAGPSCAASKAPVWVPWAPCDYRPVVLESPFSAPDPETRARNVAYLHEAMRDSIARGEAPFASHELYTRVLDDDDPAQRALGIALGLVWLRLASSSVVYVDHGISPGMHKGIDAARHAGLTIEYRALRPERIPTATIEVL